jgi:hypothetical protein
LPQPALNHGLKLIIWTLAKLNLPRNLPADLGANSEPNRIPLVVHPHLIRSDPMERRASASRKKK